MSDPQTTPTPAAPDSPADKYGAAYPSRLREAEAKRRPEPRIGVGVSGGGIRSATFALGVFQAIARNKLLGKIDYISTVSGGGYFGSFLGRLMRQPYVTSVADVEKILTSEPATDAAGDLRDASRKVIHWLRENSRYLAPRGAGDLIRDVVVMLRNWVTIQALMGTLLLAAMMVAQLPMVLWRAGLWHWKWAWLETSWNWTTTVWTRLPVDVFWSPWVVLACLPFALAIPVGWAYWLPRTTSATHAQLTRRIAGSAGAWFSVAPAVLLLGAATKFAAEASLTWLGSQADGNYQQTTAVVVGWLGLLAVGAWGVALVLAKRRVQDKSQVRSKQIRTRYMLSTALTGLLVATAAILAFGIIDTVGRTIYWSDGFWSKPFGFGLPAVFAAASGLVRRLAVLAAPKSGGARPSLPVSVTAGIVAVVLVALLLIGFDVVVQGIAWNFGTEPTSPFNFLIWLVATILLAVGFGRARALVNQSTMLNLYASRLTRAYLGASNSGRWHAGGPKQESISVSEPAPMDDVDIDEYWSASKNLPIHLINVTINETYDGQSQVQQRDRKGVGLAIGPAGMSAGVRHHAVVGGDPQQSKRLTLYPNSGYRVFGYSQPQLCEPDYPWEPLSLGQWMGVSGAAFSTGSGYHTSFGMSLLAGMANVRLGYWWDSGVRPKFRSGASRPRAGRRLSKMFSAAFRVQSFLTAEYLARFPGTAQRYWYLSDGGHFENLGGYELVRRQLPFIVIVDAEADSDYTFEGLANLVRKARLDFQTEIEFLSTDDLNRVLGPLPTEDQKKALNQYTRSKRERLEYRLLFGSLDELRPGPADKDGDDAGRFNKSGAHCALARVRYPGDPAEASPDPEQNNWLLYIKATMTGDEPADVVQYARANQTFPHQTTADQFFDESQWESYRALGHHIGMQVFSKPDGDKLWLFDEKGPLRANP